MDEIGFLKYLKQHFKLGLIGDDCAVLPFDSGSDLLATSDLLIEDIDFRLIWTEPEFLGHKALAVSLSDIAAMGGDPVWSLLSLGIPDKLWNSDFPGRFFEGVRELADEFGVQIAGGDLSRAPDKLVVDSSVIGKCIAGTALLRGGARAGDVICVSGSLGGAAAGLKLLESGASVGSAGDSPESKLILRQLKPTPQVLLGKYLYDNMLATSMIDVSDGLTSDLFHLCESSGAAAVIFEDSIPIDTSIAGAGEGNKKILSSGLELALNGGEDFELLFTTAAKNVSVIEAHSCTVIGEMLPGPPALFLEKNGDRQEIRPGGFDHFGNEGREDD